ncbi:MAG TPA: branched-chain amino acid ABC transporter permease [Spirochaetales bacterium]|nr:branched-chain amino acid ABC transporter permease [Spirochaetales bacterium]MBP7263803.1 branched-chain amino acid ABC transporter permease [Spirochaetia bacterium]HPE35654.1 branched-chain amino acid ABC transporter permease [Spirochaetales bacterium]
MLVKLLQSIIFGLPQGALYGLMGFGLSLVFGTAGVMNFAHGNAGMVGVFVGWTVLVLTKSLPAGIVAGLAAGAVLGAFMDRVLMKRVRGLSHGSMLIITLGVLMILDGLALIVWGTEPLLFPDLFSGLPILWTLPPALNPSGMPLIIPGNDLRTFLAALGSALLLAAFFRWSKPGLAARARAQDEVGAKAVGINVAASDTLAWSVGVASAVLAGFLIAPKTTVAPTMLVNLQLYGFTAAVFGGFSSMMGAVIGGLALGVIEKLVVLGLDEAFMAGGVAGVNAVDFQLSVVLIIIIVTLAARPTGLFASKFKGKV